MMKPPRNAVTGAIMPNAQKLLIAVSEHGAPESVTIVTGALPKHD